ncbi:RidA family protein [Candidatus Rariloculus sp.]|uniref:RidA family protein n=1 Tax=Candidatus Rariloculus sp. TaxID=3101265 RepID=UPI003D0F37B5
MVIAIVLATRDAETVYWTASAAMGLACLTLLPLRGGSPGRTPRLRVGNLLFLYGKLGTTEDGLVSGGIAAETRQALENTRVSLERHGSSMDRVVKCTVFLADMAEWEQMN